MSSSVDVYKGHGHPRDDPKDPSQPGFHPHRTVDMAQRKAFPLFEEAEPLHVALYPGDALFIP